MNCKLCGKIVKYATGSICDECFPFTVDDSSNTSYNSRYHAERTNVHTVRQPYGQRIGISKIILSEYEEC